MTCPVDQAGPERTNNKRMPVRLPSKNRSETFLNLISWTECHCKEPLREVTVCMHSETYFFILGKISCLFNGSKSRKNVDKVT